MKDQALYLEADEDITSAIDKLAKAGGSAVQIVVPKRSTLLQSIINLKLLKKAAADNGKELVLVTSDKVATDLAARLGLAVAPSLGAKASVGEAAPAPTAASEDIIEADDPEPEAPVIAAAAAAGAVGAAASTKAFFKRKPVTDKPTPPPVEPSVAEPVAVSETDATENKTADETAAPTSAGKSMVPNFGKLQRRIAWLALAVAIVASYFIYIDIASHATVALYAAGTKVAVDTSFVVDPNFTTSSVSTGVLAGQTVTYSKDLSGSATATGQQDAGTKATGQMTIYNNFDTSAHALDAGTRLAAPDGKVFTTNTAVSVPGETLSGSPASIHPGQVTVGVTASANGDSYNEAPTTPPAKYTIVAYPAALQSFIYGEGAQMSGGVSKIVTVVAQDDINKSETDMLAADKDVSQKTLDSHVPSGYVAMSGSTGVVASNITSSPAVGQPATTATVTLHVVYTELAVKQPDYVAFVRAHEQAQIGSTNQIYDDGVSSAQIASTGKNAAGQAQFSVSTQAYSGARIDTVALTSKLAGQRYGSAVDIASKEPGVQRVTINLTPGWLTSLPHRTSKIKITISVASDN
ncbi:hypothetical protein HJC99_00915 [Candidatus Saccharibacteria bacterium]|nr:hypothetical protein [Candidatus Saccharibacteria bacterium]